MSQNTYCHFVELPLFYQFFIIFRLELFISLLYRDNEIIHTGKAVPPANADVPVPVLVPPNEKPEEAVEAGAPPKENPVEALDAGAPPNEKPDVVEATGAPNVKPVEAVVLGCVPKAPKMVQ